MLAWSYSFCPTRTPAVIGLVVRLNCILSIIFISWILQSTRNGIETHKNCFTLISTSLYHHSSFDLSLLSWHSQSVDTFDLVSIVHWTTFVAILTSKSLVSLTKHSQFQSEYFPMSSIHTLNTSIWLCLTSFVCLPRLSFLFTHSIFVEWFASSESTVKGELFSMFITRWRHCFTVYIDRNQFHVICVSAPLCACAFVTSNSSSSIHSKRKQFHSPSYRSRSSHFNFWALRGLWLVCSAHLSQFVWCSLHIWSQFCSVLCAKHCVYIRSTK